MIKKYNILTIFTFIFLFSTNITKCTQKTTAKNEKDYFSKIREYAGKAGKGIWSGVKYIGNAAKSATDDVYKSFVLGTIDSADTAAFGAYLKTKTLADRALEIYRLDAESKHYKTMPTSEKNLKVMWYFNSRSKYAKFLAEKIAKAFGHSIAKEVLTDNFLQELINTINILDKETQEEIKITFDKFKETRRKLREHTNSLYKAIHGTENGAEIDKIFRNLNTGPGVIFSVALYTPPAQSATGNE